jgi:hypothetical protein
MVLKLNECNTLQQKSKFNQRKIIAIINKQKANSVALSPQVNYTD